MVGNYTFTINDLACQPIYSDDLALEYSLQPNEYFYKLTLSGELSFVQADYEYIMLEPFDTRFNVNVYKDGVLYFSGYFTRIDCKENIDDNVIKVALSTDDAYDTILRGYDKVHNIVSLKPALANIQIDKRPLIQVYVAGSKTVSCFLAGSYWEQDVNNIEYSSERLINTFHFSLAKESGYIKVSGTSNYPIAGEYLGYGNTFTKTTGDFKFLRTWVNPTYSPVMYMKLIRISDNKELYYTGDFTSENGEHELQPFIDSGATGTPVAKYELTRIYSRYLTDIKVVRNLTAYDIPAEDIVVNNRNYRYVIGYAIDTCYITDNYSTQPTEYGLNNIGSYFTTPNDLTGDRFYPIAKDRWITASIWFKFSYYDWLMEPEWRNTYVLRDAFGFSSVIDLLLKQISPNYYFIESNSLFLYGDNPLKEDAFRLYITPKTNITKSNYSQAAQKAELSLKQLLDMLWGVYGCKWHMEGEALHIEHVSYYKQGHTYFPEGAISLDLREETHARHYKSYIFQKNNYSYDKTDLPETIRYTYTDRVTEVFTGQPVKIISNCVQLGKIDEISVSVFNPDLDYMLLNPDDVGSDGFVLLTAEMVLKEDLIDRADSQFLSNYGLDVSGQVYESFGAYTSGYFFVTPGESYTANYSQYIICWYNSAKQLIAFILSTQATVVPPANTMYCRISFNFTQTDIMFVKGLTLSGYKVPYAEIIIDDSIYRVQNGSLSYFELIPKYHTYDLPGHNVNINGSQFLGIIKLKQAKKQSLWITYESDLAPYELIGTNEGPGFIEKMRINLTSRRVDLSLKYDTYTIVI